MCAKKQGMRQGMNFKLACWLS